MGSIEAFLAVWNNPLDEIPHGVNVRCRIDLIEFIEWINFDGKIFKQPSSFCCTWKISTSRRIVQSEMLSLQVQISDLVSFSKKLFVIQLRLGAYSRSDLFENCAAWIIDIMVNHWPPASVWTESHACLIVKQLLMWMGTMLRGFKWYVHVKWVAI